MGRIHSIVSNAVCSECKIKRGIERDCLKSQVDYQISENLDWQNKKLFVLINHLRLLLGFLLL